MGLERLPCNLTLLSVLTQDSLICSCKHWQHLALFSVCVSPEITCKKPLVSDYLII